MKELSFRGLLWALALYMRFLGCATCDCSAIALFRRTGALCDGCRCAGASRTFSWGGGPLRLPGRFPRCFPMLPAAAAAALLF